MTRQPSGRSGRAILSLGALACGLTLGLSFAANAQDSLNDPFFEEYDDMGAFGPGENTANGEIDRVDLGEGRLVIDGRTYRADPRALQGLQAGQQVFLTYEPIEDQAWIRDLQVDDGFYQGGGLYGPGF